MKHWGSIVVVLGAALGGAAWAGQASIQSTAGGQTTSVQLEYSGSKYLRMNIPEQQDSYLLVRDGRAYSVGVQEGQAYVMDLQSLPNVGFASVGTSEVGAVSDLKNTGRVETVAGVRGEVWLLTYSDANGAIRTDELVLSSDARARELTRAMTAMAQSMANAPSNPLAQQIGDKGVLRLGDQMRVTAISAGEPDASRFELPAQPTAVPALGSIGDAIGGLFGKKVDRQIDRQQDHADQRVDWETDQVLDEKVKGFMDKIFGK
mgnify:CR=1 FL=1|tara:strand:- start:2685 stop:3470 length:786 start_codon:yes stop_codon:yes gene_type:complete